MTVSWLRCRTPGVLALIVVMLSAAGAHAAHPRGVVGRNGAVASAERQATAAGLKVLEAGGNAADAAVAVALVLAVVHPQAGNLGGGGFAVVRFEGAAEALDFREVAPAGARASLYLDHKGRPVPERSREGGLAIGVPGSPTGLFELHRRYGKLPWRRVVRPALKLARDGFIVSSRLSEALRDHQERLRRYPETAAVWLPGGRVPRPGDRLQLPALAATLAAYAERGPEAISSGPVAAAVEVASRRYHGVLRAADMAAYRPVWRRVVEFDLAGWKVASMPLPSSGGIILAESVGMLDRIDWMDLPRFGADRDHLLVEVWRRAYADRFRLGDPETTEAGENDLLAQRWLDRRARSIDPRRATPSQSVKPWPGRMARESKETTHLSVVDGNGNAVALTTTLNGSFGCGVMVAGAGFLLNDEMDDFAVAPGRPNMYGLVQGRANAVRPGRRMLSSMSPTVAWQGQSVLALGSPGGSRIPTATLQVLLNFLVDGDHLQEAVDRPRIHHQWLPDVIDVEPDALSPETEGRLRRMGHRVRVVEALGEVHAVYRMEKGIVEAAADPRGPGSAGVVQRVPLPVRNGE